MISQVFLCGHTGSFNRGCEAIVRSTSKILFEAQEKIDLNLITLEPGYDRKLGLDDVLNVVPYPERPITNRLVSSFLRVTTGNKLYGYMYYYNTLFKNIDTNSVLFNIGGDTYCYGTPLLSYAQNCFAEKKHIDNVFWGCSVNEHLLHDPVMQKDINKYRYIIVRESISEKLIKQVVNNPRKVFRACDPAFHLNIKKAKLPDNFIIDNTLGINLSPLVFRDVEDDSDPLWMNIYRLMDWVISQTDMNICLIPHVYNIEEKSQDIGVLMKLYMKYSQTNRVSIIDRELSCEELKFIISNCRFFIGARTHSMIAAYSTGVPALALSYSVKSRGLAKDLFDDEHHYSVSSKDLSENDSLTSLFVNYLINKEMTLKEQYNSVLPAYKQSIIDVVTNIVLK